MNTSLARGCSVAFFTGDVTRLKEDLGAAKPTVFLSVPRILNKFKDGVSANVEKLEEGSFKRNMFEKGMTTKLQQLKEEKKYTDGWYDTLVFGKTKAVLGGKAKIVVTGGAPIAPDVQDFLRCAFSCPLSQGYGLTETTSAAFLMHPSDTTTGHVGGPVCSVEYKLVDVPEMEYTANDKPCPRGEICMRGPIIF